MKLDRKIKNDGGDILIRISAGDKMGGCGIVEMLHLWDGDAGCVIGYWEKRKVDGHFLAEFQSVHDRFITTNYTCDIFEVMRWGQKLADLIATTFDKEIE